MNLPQAIKENISILDYAKSIGLTPVKNGKHHSLKEHSSVIIDTDKNLFNRFSTNRGGTVIDFAMEFSNLSKSDAIKQLRSFMSGQNAEYNPKEKVKTYDFLDYSDICPEHLEHIYKGLVREYDKNYFKDYGVSHHDITELLKVFDSNLSREENFKAIRKTLTEFRLPPKTNGRYSRLFAYMTTERKINPKVITDVIRRKMLYEDKDFHNAVFVGFDYDGTAKYGSKRVTVTPKDVSNKFNKMDIPRSKKEVGFFVDNKSSALFLCEAPIDALSLMSILDIHNVNFNDYSYLAGGGTSMKSLIYHIPKNPNINKVYLAYDNDDAGHNARTKARETLRILGFEGKIIDKPPHNNDFNDDLKQIYISFPITINQKVEKEL